MTTTPPKGPSVGTKAHSRLGKEQLRLLRATGTNMFLIVADKRTRRLCELGLMAEARPDSFVYVTANGLRAIADAADRGQIELGKLKDKGADQ